MKTRIRTFLFALSLVLCSSAAMAAFQVYGEIAVKWNALGAAGGFLGAPLNDETGTPDGVGRYNHFENGSIYWTPQTGAHEVHGLIRDKWASMSWERGKLKYPISDEFQDGAYRRTNFQGGFVRWSEKTGAVVTLSVKFD